MLAVWCDGGSTFERVAWSQAPDVSLGPFSLQAQAPAVHAHGAMHWLRLSDHHTTGAHDVFAFDVEAVKWRLIALPQEVDQMDNPWARKKIAAVEGRLKGKHMCYWNANLRSLMLSSGLQVCISLTRSMWFHSWIVLNSICF